eukprot:scaffold7298_cov150-Skeletonema_menzelii.AAC.2
MAMAMYYVAGGRCQAETKIDMMYPVFFQSSAVAAIVFFQLLGQEIFAERLPKNRSMTFIISLFYDPNRVSRARFKRGPFYWARFKDSYLCDYCYVYVYAWLCRRFWVVGGKIADPNIRARPENAWEKGLWPLMNGPQHKFLSVFFFFMCAAMFYKNMRR